MGAVTCSVPESEMYLGKMLQPLMGQVHLDALTSWVWGNLVSGFPLFTGNPSFQPVSQVTPFLESLEAAWLSGRTLGSSPGFLLPGCVTVCEMLYLSGPSFPDSPNEGLH